MDADLLTRIHRLHAAIGRVEERELSKFPAGIYSDDQRRVMVQDFSGGMSEADMSESLHGLIHNIASFHDHLQKWGERNRVSRESIHNFLKNSFDFCVVRDLWNNDKHGHPPDRNDGWSRMAPRLANVHSVCELSAGPGKASTVMTMGKTGHPVSKTKGKGGVRVVLTGEVVDKNGSGLGDAHRFIDGALRVCEAALRHFGVIGDTAAQP